MLNQTKFIFPSAVRYKTIIHAGIVQFKEVLAVNIYSVVNRKAGGYAYYPVVAGIKVFCNYGQLKKILVDNSTSLKLLSFAHATNVSLITVGRRRCWLRHWHRNYKISFVNITNSYK